MSFSTATKEERIGELNRRRRKSVETDLTNLLREINSLSIDELAIIQIKKEESIHPNISQILMNLYQRFVNNLTSPVHAVGLGFGNHIPEIGGDDLPKILTPVLMKILNDNPGLLQKDTLSRLDMLSDKSDESKDPMGYFASIYSSISEAKAMKACNITIPYDEYENNPELTKSVDLRITKEGEKQRNTYDNFARELNASKTEIDKFMEETCQTNSDFINRKSAELKATEIMQQLNKKYGDEKLRFKNEILWRCELLDDLSLINLSYFLIKCDVESFKPHKNDILYLHSPRSNWKVLYDLCAKRFGYYFFQDYVPQQMHSLNQLVTGLYGNSGKYKNITKVEKEKLAMLDLASRGISNIGNTLSQNNQISKEKSEILQNLRRGKITTIQHEFKSQHEYVSGLMKSSDKDVSYTTLPIFHDRTPSAALASQAIDNIKSTKIQEILNICEKELKRLKKEGESAAHKIATFAAFKKYLNEQRDNDTSLKEIISAAKSQVVILQQKTDNPENASLIMQDLIHKTSPLICAYKSKIVSEGERNQATLGELLSARRSVTLKLFKKPIKSLQAWNEIEKIAGITSLTPEFDKRQHQVKSKASHKPKGHGSVR